MISRKATVLVLTTKLTAANRKHKIHRNTRQENTQKPKPITISKLTDPSLPARTLHMSVHKTMHHCADKTAQYSY